MNLTADAPTWVATWGPLATLVSTVALAAITAWYAILTKSLARSARDSADQARLAAEASRTSAAATEASVDVQFDLVPGRQSTAGEMRWLLTDLTARGMRDDEEVTPDLLAKVMAWRQVLVTCRGATVTVHGFDLSYVAVDDPPSADSSVRRSRVTTFDEGYELQSAVPLPRLCHSGESIRFDISGRPVGELVSQIRGVVHYSIGNGPKRGRQAKWSRKETGQQPRNEDRPMS
ncbi:Uncharacterised protein [Mycobacteroides abscessus]|nr:Uncharacterised protein [Mycobacteroides abscessus]CPX57583.1 Uncharacterised protein [Mycobacteroides abscessus]CPZ36219.1 Uncharacterised protein [Mycobacteroides abscessus]